MLQKLHCAFSNDPGWSEFKSPFSLKSASFGIIGFLLFPENHPSSSHPSYPISQFLTLAISDSFDCSHFTVSEDSFHESSGSTSPLAGAIPFELLSLPVTLISIYSPAPPPAAGNFQWNKTYLLIIPSSIWIQSHVLLPKVTVFISGTSPSLSIM